jgi:CO/xanthine dehydrogenase Mo-binding subunit
MSCTSRCQAVYDPDEALRAGAPVLHDYAPDNVTKHIPIRVGDVEKGFAESDLVIEETYSTQQIEHAYLEPEAGLAYVDHDGVVTIVSPIRTLPTIATCWRASLPSRSAKCASS